MFDFQKTGFNLLYSYFNITIFAIIMSKSNTSDKQQLLEAIKKMKEIKTILKHEVSDKIAETKLKALGVKLYCPILTNI